MYIQFRDVGGLTENQADTQQFYKYRIGNEVETWDGFAAPQSITQQSPHFDHSKRILCDKSVMFFHSKYV